MATLTRRWSGRTVFHGWRIVAAAVVMQSLQSLLFWQAFGAYAAVWMQDFGWSRTTIGWLATVQRTESGLLGPLHGIWLERSSPRRVFVIGIAMMSTGMVALAFVHAVVPFVLIFLVASIGSSLCGYLTFMTVIVHWFDRYRSRAMAALQLGISGGALALPLVAWALIAFGWRPVMAVSGLLVLGIGLSIARGLERDPESLGLRPDGDPAPAAGDVAEDGPAGAAVVPGAGGPMPAAAVSVATAAGLPLRVRRGPAGGALATSAFWLISAGHGAAMAVMSAVNVHFVVFVTETLGFGLAAGATMMSLLTGAAILGQVLGGAVGDRVQKRWLAGAAMVAHGAAMVGFALWATPLAIAAAAVLHGLAWGVRGPLMGAMRADYFGRANFASVMGFSSLVVMLGSVSGPLLLGLVADGTGSYVQAFALLAGIAGVGAAAFFAVGRPPRLAA